MLARLAVAACLAVSLLATSGCKRDEQLVRGGDVVHTFREHGIVLQDTRLFGGKDAITAGYFAVTPEVSKVTVFVAVCRSEGVARDLVRRRRGPLGTAAAVRRRKNVVVYLAAGIDAQRRRGALAALASL